MHPGPMNEGVEIAPDVAISGRSVITEQVANGVAVRMALLYLLAGAHDAGPRPRHGDGSSMSPQPKPGADRNGGRRLGPAVGETVERFELEKAWLVDPVSGREGPGEIVVIDGVLESVVWLEGDEAEGVTDDGVVVAPGFFDLHAHFREPGFEDAETVASGCAAAAHGGYTTVALMPNTSPALDEPGVLERIRSAARAGGSPVEVLAYGAVSAGRAGEQLSAMGELADAGVLGYSDDGAPVKTPKLLRSALLYAGNARPADRRARRGPGADRRRRGPRGLRGLGPGAGRAGRPRPRSNAVARDLAVLADALRDEPGARLHLTHVSTAAALDLVRRAKAAGLPVTCDVTPHHLAFTDEWIAGARRWSWEALGADGTARPVGRRRATRCSVRHVACASTRRSARRSTPRPAWPPCSTERPTRSSRTTPRTRSWTRKWSSARPATASAASRRRWACCSRWSTRASCRSRGPSPR